ncbi:uncharacterized protein SAPINGB_P004455 [Magnusiomyces paraingens]|uniref:Uncharacterized protein n=1 Tax=Magnusiomyces paraingens TaxID=2606893 RepID=A0A5E8BUJ7_9ASCO|nr:uncharacterized protein SAPINGB_P004455 [Saprochaete ingens]VVT55156.1 unnamed protein product [Saprochaete ingens]
MIWLKAIYGQILTIVANLLVLCMLNSLAMLLTPVSTPIAWYIHLTNQPLLEQLRMAITSFSKKRYMIGQDGRRPFGSCLATCFLTALGLTFFFLSTIVFQTSDTALRRSPNGVAPALIGGQNMQTSNTAEVRYPLITDDYLGPESVSDGSLLQPTQLWNTSVGGGVAQSETQFNGNVSVFINDLNWMTVSDSSGKDFTTTIYMTIDGISADTISATTPGTITARVMDNSLPAIFEVPLTASGLGDAYAFAVQGKYTLDYVHFQLVSFSAETYSNSDCLDQYYQFVSSHTLDNGTLLLNNTYNYSSNAEYSQDSIESDIASGDVDVKYGLISLQNLTTDTDQSQTYRLTKRAVHRQTTIATVNGTIDVLEYDYTLSITRYAKSSLDSDYAAVYTSSSTYTDGVTLPVTPMFRTSMDTYLNVATLVHNKNLYTIFVYETYVDILPTIILIAVFGGITLLATIISYAYNIKRVRNRAYSVPLETLNFVLYTPGRVLFPMFQKIKRAEFSMVDGFDPSTGYNHMGLVSLEDAEHITHREPDVPYGLVHKNPQGMLNNPSPYS